MKRIKLGMMEQEQQGRLSIQKDRYMIIWLRNYRVFKSAEQMHRFERAIRHITIEFKIVETIGNSFSLLPVCYHDGDKEYRAYNFHLQKGNILVPILQNKEII